MMTRYKSIDSDKKGVKFYQRALELARRDENDPLVVEYLNKSIEQGNSDAMYALGLMHLKGNGNLVTIDEEKGAALMIRASRLGNADAHYNAAIAYEKGISVDKDDFAALSLYLRASLFGDLEAVYEFGRSVYYGVGMSKNQQLGEFILDCHKELKKLSNNNID